MQNFINIHKYFLALVILYLLLRLISLTIIPIFNDESIYLDFGWRELHLNLPFYSLFDGKQPFLMWLFGLSESIFSDPLFAGRIISVLAGFFTMWGLYRIGKEIFSEKVGFIAALFYIIIPLFSFFDRQALMESSVAATEVWTVYLFLWLLKNRSKKIAIMLGVVVGIGFFIKSTILLLILAIVIVYLFILKMRPRKKSFLRNIFIAIIVSQVILLPLYWQTQFWQTLSLNDRYSMNLGELIKFPVISWVSNVWVFLQIAFWHLTPFVFVAVIIGLVLIMRSDEKNQKTMIWIFLFQIFFFVLIAKGINPRYEMPMLPLSTIPVALVIDRYKRWNKVLLGGLAVVPVYFLFLQLFQPLEYFNQLQAFTPYSQKDVYVTGSTAGYAVTQAIEYVKSTDIPAAFVAVRLDAGNPENTVFTYFYKSKTRKATYLQGKIIANLSDYQCLTFTYPIYFVSRDYQLGGLDNYLQEDKRFYNPGNQSSVGVYQLRYPCSGKTLNLASPGAILQPAQNQ